MIEDTGRVARPEEDEKMKTTLGLLRMSSSWSIRCIPVQMSCLASQSDMIIRSWQDPRVKTLPSRSECLLSPGTRCRPMEVFMKGRRLIYLKEASD